MKWLLVLLALVGALAQAQLSGPSMNAPGVSPSASLPALTATSGTITPGILIAGACGSGTVAVTGSTTAMPVVASANTYPGDGVVPLAYVSSNGTVTVKVCAIIGLTPNASTYNVRVIQ